MEIPVVSERFTFAAEDRTAKVKSIEKKTVISPVLKSPVIDTTESISCIHLASKNEPLASPLSTFSLSPIQPIF